MITTFLGKGNFAKEVDRTRLTALFLFRIADFDIFNTMLQLGQNHWMLLGAITLYTLSLLFALWRLTLGQAYRHWPKLTLVLPGFLLHTIYLWKLGLSQGRCPVSNLFETLCLIAWS